MSTTHSLPQVQRAVPCNMCGGTNFRRISSRDRHDLLIISAMCRRCGLISINPRMSLSDYDNLYRSGENHRLWMQLNKTVAVPNFEQRYDGAYQFGEQVAEVVREYVNPGLVIEVGSGTGGVLAAFRDKLGIQEVMGIDPSPQEARIAEGHGVPTILKTFESCTPQDISPATVMSSQSLNHLYDPRGFLTWAHNILPSEGVLILVVQNFLDLARKKCSIGRATQIDHIYMFTPTSLQQCVLSAGFDIVFLKEQSPTSVHMILVAKKNSRVPFETLDIDPKMPEKTLAALAVIRRSCLWRQFKRSVKRLFRRR